MQDEIIDVDTGYTVCQNTIIQDDSLSYFAIGIFLYLKSKPKDWKVITKHLQKRNNTTEYAIRKGLRELRDAGYMKWVRVQSGFQYFISSNAKYKEEVKEKVHCVDNHYNDSQYNDSQQNIYIQNKELNKIKNNTNNDFSKSSLSSQEEILEKEILTNNSLEVKEKENPPTEKIEIVNTKELELEEQFEEIWQAYSQLGNAGSKKISLTRFKNIIKNKGISVDEIKEGVLRYYKFMLNERKTGFNRKTKAFEAWLNGEYWKGDYSFEEKTDGPMFATEYF